MDAKEFIKKKKYKNYTLLALLILLIASLVFVTIIKLQSI